MQTSAAVAVASELVESSVNAAEVVVVAAGIAELGGDDEESWEDNWCVAEVVEADIVDMEVLEVQDKQHGAMKDGMLWGPAQHDKVLAAEASDGGKDRQALSEAQRTDA